MANILNRLSFTSRFLTSGKVLFSILAVLALGVVVNAQTVVRTNGGTETGTGTDVSDVQLTYGSADQDVISVDGTSETVLAPFATEVNAPNGGYNVSVFTVQSATGEKQYIGAPASASSHNYVLSGSSSYNLTFNNVEFQNDEKTFSDCLSGAAVRMLHHGRGGDSNLAGIGRTGPCAGHL